MDSFIIDNSKQSKFKQLVTRFKEPRVFIPSGFLLLFLIVGVSVFYRYNIANRTSDPAKKSGLFSLSQEEKKVVSNLDGLHYSESVANRHALGVMIENHPESRPQSGLSEASVVYEAQAEGGITRFLAIFGPQIPEKVGPVRSARPYYLDWCLEYDCFYAHVGGNIAALDLIPKLGVKDLDQFRYGVKKYNNAYYRTLKKGVASEHTVYANPAKLYGLAKDNNWPDTGGYPIITFKQDAKPTERPSGQIIEVEISSRQYNVSWNYDSSTNTYARTMGGAIHTDAGSSKQITSKVIIVQEVPSRTMVTRINEKGLEMDTVGTGQATIIQDGQVIVGSWKKAKQTERTIFYDANNQEIRYNPGQRWITIVNPGAKITVGTASTPTPW